MTLFWVGQAPWEKAGMSARKSLQAEAWIRAADCGGGGNGLEFSQRFWFGMAWFRCRIFVAGPWARRPYRGMLPGSVWM